MLEVVMAPSPTCTVSASGLAVLSLADAVESRERRASVWLFVAQAVGTRKQAALNYRD